MQWYLWNAYVPGPILGICDPPGNRTENTLPSGNWHPSVGTQTSKRASKCVVCQCWRGLCGERQLREEGRSCCFFHFKIY